MYDIIIIGAGPGGIFAAYELIKNNKNLKVAIIEKGKALNQRKCPIDGNKVKSCIKCPVCSIMSGFGGAGAFSDGKYNITNDFGGTLYEHIGREEALKLVVDYLEATDLVVSTTGKLSRELFEYREAEGEGHECDFLTVGSMGHSSSIALGIALANSERRVFCLDGDGAFIMHMGAIGNIGYLSPKNYFHILFNNGSHESVGGQPTIGFQLDIPAIAKACGYRTVFSLTTKDEIKEILQQTKIMEGPVLIELKVKVASRDDLGRPTTTPLENKFHFMEFLKNK